MTEWWNKYLNKIRKCKGIGKMVIILPTYNREKLIHPALVSVMAQTYTTWELYILDDASTDGTKSVVDEVCKDDDRVNYIYIDKKSKPTELHELGCRIAMKRGEFWTRLASDDKFANTKIENDVNFLTNHKEFGAGYGPFYKMNEVGHVLHVAEESKPMSHSELLDKIKYTFVMSWANIVVRTSVLEKILYKFGHFSHPSLRNMEDWVFNLMLLLTTTVGWSGDKPQGYYRLHSGQAGADRDIVGKDVDTTKAL
ncbi:unnamed protein product, partial [marine sediment metagenome]